MIPRSQLARPSVWVPFAPWCRCVPTGHPRTGQQKLPTGRLLRLPRDWLTRRWRHRGLWDRRPWHVGLGDIRAWDLGDAGAGIRQAPVAGVDLLDAAQLSHGIDLRGGCFGFLRGLLGLLLRVG